MDPRQSARQVQPCSSCTNRPSSPYIDLLEVSGTVFLCQIRGSIARACELHRQSILRQLYIAGTDSSSKNKPCRPKRRRRRNISRLLCGSKKRQERSRKRLSVALQKIAKEGQDTTLPTNQRPKHKGRGVGKILPRQSLREDGKRKRNQNRHLCLLPLPQERTAKSKLNALLLRLAKRLHAKLPCQCRNRLSLHDRSRSVDLGLSARTKAFEKSRPLPASKTVLGLLPEPTKKNNIVVDYEYEKGKIAVGLCAVLKELPLQGPVEEAADRIGPLCNSLQL